ncbi:MAG: EVE domain-containing protein [Leptolyngbya sp. DLM2.Bin15]|nr:MAG: EVE domain-containing protein [Leptolyngbya sp. DLM2.Bin15]
MNYWLMKSEPDVYGIDRLAADTTTLWDGVRNYQARNFLREMQVGDLVFFYHSNTKPPGIVGLMEVTESGVVDPTQFDPQSHYYDAKSTPEAPRWQTVQVSFVRKFTDIITLDHLRETFSPDDLWVVRRGNRLSVVPVPGAIAEKILEMAQST